mgnify:CR=1 FL=1
MYSFIISRIEKLYFEESLPEKRKIENTLDSIFKTIRLIYIHNCTTYTYKFMQRKTAPTIELRPPTPTPNSCIKLENKNKALHLSRYFEIYIYI